MKQLLLAGMLGVITFVPLLAIAEHTLPHAIQILEAKIAELQVQLVELRAKAAAEASCQFLRDLSIGAQGGDVQCLQDYLAALGYFASLDGSTGYFGPITRSAVTAWQAVQGITPAAGYFGQLSRAKYHLLAGTQAAPLPTTPPPSAPTIPPPAPPRLNQGIVLSANPTSGPAPLVVTFMATLQNFPSCGSTFVWSFGDGINLGVAEACAAPVVTLSLRTISLSHTYQVAGTYTATLAASNVTSNALNITVTAGGTGAAPPPPPPTSTSTPTDVSSPPPQPAVPSIRSLVPDSGPLGTSITIHGSGFTPTGNTVNYGFGQAKDLTAITSSSGQTITFVAQASPVCTPASTSGIVSCYAPTFTTGSYPVTVTNTNGTSNSITFTLTAGS